MISPSREQIAQLSAFGTEHGRAGYFLQLVLHISSNNEFQSCFDEI